MNKFTEESDNEERNILNPIKDSNEIMVVNGREYRAHQFKPGNTYIKNKAGKQHKTTVISKLVDRTTLNQFKALVATEGVTRLWAIMQEMSDMDFVKTFIFVAPYCLPKIASVESKGSDVIHPIDDHQHNTHTITIKDMRTGNNIVINDD